MLQVHFPAAIAAAVAGAVHAACAARLAPETTLESEEIAYKAPAWFKAALVTKLPPASFATNVTIAPPPPDVVAESEYPRFPP